LLLVLATVMLWWLCFSMGLTFFINSAPCWSRVAYIHMATAAGNSEMKWNEKYLFPTFTEHKKIQFYYNHNDKRWVWTGWPVGPKKLALILIWEPIVHITTD
jgi:hypothetical protein